MLSNLQLDTLVFTSIMPWYLILQDISLAVSCRLVLQIFIFGDLLDAAAIFQDISLAVSCRLVLQIFIFGDLLDVAVDEVGVGVLDHVGPLLHQVSQYPA